MNTLGLNPYLPFWEFVPDGEPHLFDGRVYIYGSHDRAGGTAFCVEDYVCWSAPAEDLGNWRCEGVIYRKGQDPINGAPYDKKIPEYDSAFSTGEAHLLYAPDVAQGPDGRYYLYYSLDFTNIISVAVCDTPAGQYEFLDYVAREDGSRPNVGRWFDPAVLSEEGGNYLYYGFCPPTRFPGMEDLEIPGSMMVRLADDMHTIISEPVCVANGCDTAKGTSYEEHPFFEASSIRHYGDWYYLVYSSLQGHELCYGMARTPEGPFAYKGVIHSNGDLGYQGNGLAVNYTGNNHGGLVQVGEEYYIFGHRHTHGTAFSRQGVAEKVVMLEDGTIPQVEMTSCGLNGGPLPAKGKYRTYTACHLTEGDRTKVGQVVMTGPDGGILKLPEEMPYITEESCESEEKGLRSYICNLGKEAVCGFKYLSFTGDESRAELLVRGDGEIGICMDTPDGEIIGSAACQKHSKSQAEVQTEGQMENPTECRVADWERVEILFPEDKKPEGSHAVYFRVLNGRLDFAEFEIR